MLTVGGFDVLEARISLPRVGVWTADLVVDATSTDKLTGSVTISIAEGKLELVGTVKRPGVHLETVLLRVRGGAGGMGKLAKPKDYDDVKAREVIEDLLKDAGESLS